MQYAHAMVYKEYKPQVASSVDVAVLESMPTYLEGLPANDALELLTLVAWPCRTVEGAGKVLGFVMPAIPSHFFLEMKKAGGLSTGLGEFQHLLNGNDFLARREINLTDQHRYELIGELAAALAVFHRHGIAVGDISPKNLLFSLAPHTRVYFIDCDAMRFRGRSVTQQLETPDWEVPIGEELATPESDRFKLGLMALRLLVSDQTTRDITQLPRTVPQAVADLITQSLSATPSQRPTPTRWAKPAIAAAQAASTRFPRTRTTPAVAARPTPSNLTTITHPTGAPPVVAPIARNNPTVQTPRRPGWFARRTSRAKLGLAAIGILSLIVIGNSVGGSGTDGTTTTASSTAPTARTTRTPVQPIATATASPASQTDADIRTGVLEALERASITTVRVSVTDGVVTLRGSAAEEEVERSTAVAGGVSGVVRVANLMVPTDAPTPEPTLPADSVVQEAIRLAADFAARLAAGDWDDVRRYDIDLREQSDQQLERGYGMLNRNWVVPIQSNRSGQLVELRILLVAHETVNGIQETNPFCLTWVVDTANRSVDQTGQDSVQIFGPTQRPKGWVTPSLALDEWAPICFLESRSASADTDSGDARPDAARPPRIDQVGPDHYCIAQNAEYPYLHEASGVCHANPIGK